MNKDLFDKLVNRAGEMALANIWGEKALKINMAILEMDNKNSAACTRLAKYYKLNDNLAEAKKMYSRALEINPENQGARNNLIELERYQDESEFINKLATGKDAYTAARTFSQKGRYALSIKCLKKAYSLEPILKYAVTLAKIYNKTGRHNEVINLYNQLLDAYLSTDNEDAIKSEFKALLQV
ncbi:MAG TPA: hypothetical protein VHT34_02020 [Clostridia bacterium]|nr:hypothetical protein [Clostridia bacterium]